ncbi:hypothetical protein [Treponema zioleckii]|uniref:hypothetical protein n=1 Tax=Treponema zioleckii TaxID=331680 RepID=UPI00168AAC2C|nr:hypothetical protein [Treponema zioleckii]
MKKSIFLAACVSVVYLGIMSTIPVSAQESESQTENKLWAGEMSGLYVRNVYTDSVALLVRPNKDNVKVYSAPSLNGKVVGVTDKTCFFFILGMKETEDVVNGVKGNWLNVSRGLWPEWEATYWIFSEDVDIGDKLKPSKMSFVEFCPIVERHCPMVKISIKRNADRKPVEVEIPVGGREFVWNFDNDGAFFTDPVGIFRVEEDGTIKHLSHFGHSMESDFFLSESGNYIISPQGTCPGVCGVVVFDAQTYLKIFSGDYYIGKNFRLFEGDTLYCVHPYNILEPKNEKIAEYIKNNPLPEEKKNSGFDWILVEHYTHNLKTGEEKSLGYEYVITQ